MAYPTADWTWKDEQAAAEKMTDAAAGVFGDYQPISYNEFYKALAPAGGSRHYFAANSWTTTPSPRPTMSCAACLGSGAAVTRSVSSELRYQNART